MTREWQTEATGYCQDEVTLAHGRIEQRSIAVFMPPQAIIDYPHVKQIVRVTRHSMDQDNRRRIHRVRLRHDRRRRQPCNTARPARLDPRSPAGRTPSPCPGCHLQRRRLDRPHPIRTIRQGHHQHHRDRRDPGAQPQDRQTEEELRRKPVRLQLSTQGRHEGALHAPPTETALPKPRHHRCVRRPHNATAVSRIARPTTHRAALAGRSGANAP